MILIEGNTICLILKKIQIRKMMTMIGVVGLGYFLLNLILNPIDLLPLPGIVKYIDFLKQDL